MDWDDDFDREELSGCADTLLASHIEDTLREVRSQQPLCRGDVIIWPLKLVDEPTREWSQCFLRWKWCNLLFRSGDDAGRSSG
jgi:hypothetical protein